MFGLVKIAHSDNTPLITVTLVSHNHPVIMISTLTQEMLQYAMHAKHAQLDGT
jgi:hypothetical protein